ncbi:hypothetical protein HU200_036070 [Digitaria exilis]|uniref:Uncharacterized protein n=1 Tax=Digitaria exilis TaxID=1010633 RepID=A0A835BQV9_9POAL|nr:hypothetical protein HU200_036070 [Digitaria exilis]
MGSATPLYDEIPDHRHRFVDYAGEGFLFGAAFGSAFYAIKGFRNSAVGGRLAGAGRAALVNAPRVGGMLGTISFLFSASNSAMALARQKDDPWNSIVAGATSMGLFHMHLGARTAAVSALIGATVSVALEGFRWVSDDHARYASDAPTPTKNSGLFALATTPSHGSSGAQSWLRSPSTSITGNK